MISVTLREQTEALERETLSPFACLSSRSRGRPVPAKTHPDAFPQVAGEAPGVSCIGLLRRAAASGGD